MEFICSDIRNNVDFDRASLAVEIAFKITWSDSMNNLTIDFPTETLKNERHDLHPLADKKIILGGNISFFLSLVLHLGLERSDLMETFHHLSPLVPDGFSIYSSQNRCYLFWHADTHPNLCPGYQGEGCHTLGPELEGRSQQCMVISLS